MEAPRPCPTDADPLDEYLYSPVLQVKDPLKYWESQDLENNPLAQFALDFLSALHESRSHLSVCWNSNTCSIATSTGCERSFSSGSQTMSQFRHSLSNKSVRASKVLGSWAAAGLVPEEEILADFKSRGKHWQVEEPAPVPAIEEVPNDDVTSDAEVMDVDLQ